jgi:hypothetical protein
MAKFFHLTLIVTTNAALFIGHNFNSADGSFHSFTQYRSQIPGPVPLFKPLQLLSNPLQFIIHQQTAS